jgi:hypothetical protein
MTVKLAKCPRCGKLFSKSPATLVCINCKPLEDADYDKVREVLGANPGLNPDGLAQKAGVPLACVKRLMEDGRVASGAVDKEMHKCGRCGAPAISADKRLCEGWLHELEVQNAEHMRVMQEKLRGIKPSKVSFKTSEAKKPGMAALERHQVGSERKNAGQRMAIRERIEPEQK